MTACVVIGGDAAAQAALGAVFDVTCVEHPEDLTASDAEYAFFQGHKPLDGSAMDLLPNLKVIANNGVGYDAIDVAAAVARGIIVTHTPNVLNDEVANTALMLMLMVARNALVDNAYLQAGRWASEGNAPLSRGIAGLKVGILGLGRIGKVVAEKLGVFQVEVAYHGRRDQGLAYQFFPDLEQMAQAVDVLICVAPGGAATRHLINDRVMTALGPRGILINVGRGSVVDEQALIAALHDGRLGYAGLDVFEDEPNVPAGLMGLEQVTLLPHVGSATVETRQAMQDLAVRNLTSHAASGTVETAVPECRGLV